jgi:hypothetical protein
MRRFSTIGVGVLMTLASIGSAQVRQTVIIAPNIARTITVSRVGVVLVSLTVPQGTVLSVTYDEVRSRLPGADGRFEFHGDVELRVVVASQRARSVTLEEAMQQAPLLLTIKAGDVVIAPPP